jgi:DNA repair protein RecO (recombination protein O)
MLVATKAIFFHQINYSETSVIAKVYTRNFGLKSFIIKGAKGKKSGLKINILQPLNILNIVATIKEKASLHHLKELSLSEPINYTERNFIKDSLKIFLSEVFLKSIKEEESNPVLFDFLEKVILNLSKKQSGLGIFHLVVLIQLSTYLGYGIADHILTAYPDEEINNRSNTAKDFILLYANVPLEEEWPASYTANIKKEVLLTLVRYYETNIIKNGAIKSHKILEEIL